MALILSTLIPTLVKAEDLYIIKAKQFLDQLRAYNQKHDANLEIMTQYANKEKTEVETRFLNWTICNTVTNLERAEALILDTPEYAQYLDGAMLPSIQENLDFHRYAASILDGTPDECQ